MSKHPFHEHHDKARQAEQDVSAKVIGADVLHGILNALIALVWIQAAQWREQRRIRKALEGALSNNTVQINLTGRVVSKEGD